MILKDLFTRDRRGMGRTGTIIMIALVLAASVGVGGLIGYLTSGKGSISNVWSPPFGGKRIVRILMLGEDNTGLKGKQRGLSDTIILLSLNLDNKSVAALSIPRDTRVNLDGYGGECKINAAHKSGGPMLTAMVVEKLVGIRPDYYIKTNLDGFKKCVDLLGGVEIDVEKNMRYTDNWGGLHIDLKKGRQLLGGEDAMGYIRFRHDALGDITRMERQQKFLKALATRAIAPANLPKLPRIVQTMVSNVETDLTPRDILYLTSLARTTNMDDVKTATLPATPQNIGGISYMIADVDKIGEVVEELFFTQTNPGLPKVEVLNGSGISGAAQKVADALRRQGYEVVEVGNADSYKYGASEVITHKEKLSGVENISRIVNSQNIRCEKDPASHADVTVVVGKDCLLLNS